MSTEPRAVWWLSFMREEDDTFLGVALIEAESIAEATLLAWTYECNPGGQIGGIPLRPDLSDDPEYLERYATCHANRNRLLSIENLIELGLWP